MNLIIINILIINSIKVLCFKTNFDDLSRYLDQEQLIINVFHEYLSSEENRIFRLRQKYERFRQQNTIALKDKDLFLNHPNDVYFLIKRIAIEWKTVEDLLESNRTIKYKLFSLLDQVDSSQYNFTETVEGYEKLIYYYEQSITSAANGVLKLKTSSSEQNVMKSISNQTFDAFDCYSIGMQSFNNRDYLSAVEWFEEALHRADYESRPEVMSDIFEFISVSDFKSKNSYKMNEILEELEDHKEDSPIAKFMLNFFTVKLSSIKRNTTESDKTEQVKFNPPNEQDQFSIKPEIELYDRNDYLCLGRKLMNISYESKLKCFYLNTTLRPYLRLTRVRVEELYKRPQIVLIHNFLSETEAQTLKNMTKDKLSPTGVVNARTGQEMFDFKTRITQHLYINNHSLVKTIERRILEITGLNSEISEERMKVVRYNIGGIFNIHRDSPSDPDNPAFGRIAAWVTYLSDDVVGGATVFPKYNVTVFPQKYSALLWYHLLSSCDIDYDMWHTGCPVLFGQKWISVKHMGIKGQDFNKCSKTRYEPRTLQVI